MPDAATRTIRRKAGIRRMALRRAVPSAVEALAGGLAWAALMAASAVLELSRDGWETRDKIVAVATVFAAGGAMALPLALFLSRLVGWRRHREARFAAAFLALAICTIGATAGIYALWYRDYYAEWHEPAFSVPWVFQFIVTTIGALFQFAVLGLRLYFPLGFAALIAASLWLATRRPAGVR